jgi:hypothetical protein
MNAVAESRITLKPEVAEFCARAVAALHAMLPVREVWLFGSQAEGTANRHSDYDFLVVLADDHGIRRPNLESYSAISDVAHSESVDALSATESRWRREQAAPWGLFGDIVRKGVRIG